MSAKRHELVAFELSQYRPDIPILPVSSETSPMHFFVTPKALAKMRKQNGNGFAHRLLLVHPELMDTTGLPKTDSGLSFACAQENSNILEDETTFTGNFDTFHISDSKRMEGFLSEQMILARDITPGFDPSALTANQCCFLALDSESEPQIELVIFKAQSQAFVRVPKPYLIPNKISPFTAELAFARYLLLDESLEFVFLHGPAGTGKSTMAIHSAIAQLLAGRYSRIDILKTTWQAAGQPSLGALPGDFDEKFAGPRKPVNITLEEVKQEFASQIKAFLRSKAPGKGKGDRRGKRREQAEVPQQYYNLNLPIFIDNPADLRGGNFKAPKDRRIVIIEEGQNWAEKLLLMTGTRYGKGCKVVVVGDGMQIDNPNLSENNNGMVNMMSKLKKRPSSFGQVKLTRSLREGPAGTLVECYYD
jgi:hypothetical protein